MKGTLEALSQGVKGPHVAALEAQPRRLGSRHRMPGFRGPKEAIL
jgi:hypothetical protein